jgi:hypothetical protein
LLTKISQFSALPFVSCIVCRSKGRPVNIQLNRCCLVQQRKLPIRIPSAPQCFPGSNANMKTMVITLTFVALAAISCPTRSCAGLLVYDGFDYNSATLTGNNGGGGLWTGAWAAQGASNLLSNPATNLNYTAGHRTLVTTGSSVQSIGGFQQVDARSWDTSGRFAEGNAIWFSSLINITSGIDFRFWAISANNNVYNGIGLAVFGSTLSGRIIGANDNQISGTSGLGLTAGQDHFVVGRIGFEAGSLITLNVWLDPDLGSTPSLADSVSTSRVMPAVSEASWRYALIRSGTRSPNDFRFDEVRIGTDFASVSEFTAVPEPGSLLLVAPALAFFLSRRRRPHSLAPDVPRAT